MLTYVLPITWLNRFLPRPYFLTVHGVLQESILELVARRNINNLRYADDTTLIAKSEKELKILLMKVKEESEMAGFKLNNKKTKIMAFSPITSWQISSVQFSHSVVSDSLRPHELQLARPPCPSPTPRVHSNSRPSSQ